MGDNGGCPVDGLRYANYALSNCSVKELQLVQAFSSPAQDKVIAHQLIHQLNRDVCILQYFCRTILHGSNVQTAI